MMLLFFSFEHQHRDIILQDVINPFHKWLPLTKFYGGCQVYKNSLGMTYRILTVDCSSGFLICVHCWLQNYQEDFVYISFYLSF